MSNGAEPMMRDIRVVFFDAGETLLHPRPSFVQLFETTCAEHGIFPDTGKLPSVAGVLLSELDQRQREGFTFSTSTEVSRAFWLDFYARLLEGLGAPSHDELPLQLYRTFTDPANYVLYGDVTAALKGLECLGVGIGLISNFEAWLEVLLERLGVLSYFKHLVISGQVGMEKPHRRIFEHALAVAGVEPGQALHVGDSIASDVAGARGAGITPVLIDRYGLHPQADCLRLEDLRQLAPLLKTGEGPS